MIEHEYEIEELQKHFLETEKKTQNIYQKSIQKK